MKRPARDRLIEILHIIKYANNKEKFIQEFEEMSHLEATVNLIESLSTETQELLQKQNPEKIKDHISPETYVAEILKVTERKLEELIVAVSPALNFSQKQQIKQVMSD